MNQNLPLIIFGSIIVVMTIIFIVSNMRANNDGDSNQSSKEDNENTTDANS